MSSPMDLLEAIESYDVVNEASAALSTQEESIADQIAGQLSAGVNGDGSEIEPEYAYLTVQLKTGKKGLAGVTNRVTLFDTGSHYEKLFIDVKGKEYISGSHDEKSLDLQAKYGEGIYQTGEDARENVINEGLLEVWQKGVEEVTGLKFK